MDLALGSAAATAGCRSPSRRVRVRIEPTLLLDPHADLILDANPAACTLLGYDRALLRQTKVSALHAGQLPALIVFTQAVLDKGALLDQRADAAPRHRANAQARICRLPACRATAARWCCSP